MHAFFPSERRNVVMDNSADIIDSLNVRRFRGSPHATAPLPPLQKKSDKNSNLSGNGHGLSTYKGEGAEPQFSHSTYKNMKHQNKHPLTLSKVFKPAVSKLCRVGAGSCLPTPPWEPYVKVSLHTARALIKLALE
jgi:hypothetical protein